MVVWTVILSHSGRRARCNNRDGFEVSYTQVKVEKLWAESYPQAQGLCWCVSDQDLTPVEFKRGRAIDCIN